MPRSVDKRAKAREISQAAIRVFRERGFHETRMAAIVGGAGIGNGTLYEYLTGKTELVQFIFDDYFSSFSEGPIAALDGAAAPHTLETQEGSE